MICRRTRPKRYKVAKNHDIPEFFTMVGAICIVAVVTILSFFVMVTDMAYAAGEDTVSECPAYTAQIAGGKQYVLWIAGVPGATRHPRNNCGLYVADSGLNSWIATYSTQDGPDVLWAGTLPGGVNPVCYVESGGAWVTDSNCTNQVNNMNYTIKASTNPLLHEVWRSNAVSLYAHNPKTGYNQFPNWDNNLAAGQLIYGPYVPPPSITVTPLQSTVGLTAPANLQFTISWLNWSGSLKHITLTSTIGADGTGACVIDCSTLHYVYDGPNLNTGHGSGSIVTPDIITYSFSGSYTPFARASNCSLADSIGGGTCHYTVGLAAPFNVSGEADADAAHTYRLDFPYASPRVPHQLQYYHYVIDNSVCPSSAVSSVRIFKGYPYPYDSYDAGEVLAGSSGTGSMSYSFSSLAVNSQMYPFYRMLCADGSYVDIYNGSTQYKAQASGLYIDEPNFNNPGMIGYGTKGGYSQDFDSITGSGAYFLTDKDVYEINEPATFTYYYKTTFTPASVVIYLDPTQLPSYVTTLTGALATTNGAEHTQRVTYPSAGRYYPKIQVRKTGYNPSDPTTYRDIWMGGATVKQSEKYLTVTSNYYGQNGFVSGRGVFGLDPATFTIGFGNTQNPALDLFNSILTVIMRGVLYLASMAFSILAQAPIFSMFTDLVTPQAGATYYLPTTLFGQTMPTLPYSPFTITYATTQNGAVYDSFIKFIVMGGVVVSFITALF